MPGWKLRSPLKIAIGLAFAATAVVAVLAETVIASTPKPEQQSKLPAVNRVLPNLYEQSRPSEPLLLAQRQVRKALVIGNAAYEEDALVNPVNDATDFAVALRSLGFEVTLLTNLDLRTMDNAIKAFSRQLKPGEVGLFYYAGHGVQVEGENYLVPLQADLDLQADVKYEAVPLGKVLNAMEAAATQVNILIIDACRDNPFYRRWRSGNRSTVGVRGLAPIELPTQGTVIAFATAPGDVAEDGKGRNSPYTSHLLQNIKRPNLDVAEMFRAVRAGVLQETNSKQVPWYQESLVGKFVFNSTRLPSTPIPVATTPPVTSTTEPPFLTSSATGVNYKRLDTLLAAQNWKEADAETNRVMLQAEGGNGNQLSTKALNTFPCEDLRLIDRLWREHSGGRFGFSVQAKILKKMGWQPGDFSHATWSAFYERVGWSGGRATFDFTFVWELNNPIKRGFLPWLGGENYMRGEMVMDPLLSRSVNCNI